MAFYNPANGEWSILTNIDEAVEIANKAKNLFRDTIPPQQPSIEACRRALQISSAQYEPAVNRVIRLVSQSEHQYNDGTPMSAVFADIVTLHRKGHHAPKRQCTFDATRGKMIQYKVQPRSTETN